MIRKLLAVLICASMALTAPGMGELFAQGGRPVLNSSGKVVQILPAERDEAQANLGNDLNVQDLQSTISNMHASQQMKGRAIDVLGRVEPYLKDGRMRPDDVRKAIQDFQTSIAKDGANKEAALADLFDGLQAFAVRAEKFGTYRQVLVNKDDTKVVRLIDGLNNRVVEEERMKKLDDGTQRLVVYKPDPQNPGKMIIELIKYTYRRHGTVEERVVYNRRLLQIADGMEKQYAETVDLDRQLKEALAEKNQTDANILKTRIENMKTRYGQWGLGDIQKRLAEGDDSLEIVKKRTMIRPHDADVMAKRLEDYARRMGEFEAIDRQENLQKVALIEFVMFFVQSLGLQYNPFNEGKSDKEGVGITNMSIEDVNKRLVNFEKGNYYGYGLIGDLCAACVPSYRKVDPEKDMPPSLKAIAAKLIRYLGDAHAARVRLDAMRLLCRPNESGETGDKCSREQEQAFLDDMSLWNKMAAVQIQKFEIVSHSIMLERIKSGDNSEEVRLRTKDAEAAGKLIKMAREQFTVKFGDLETRAQDNAKIQAAFKLKTSIEDLSLMNLSDRDVQDKLGAMTAKVMQLEALYLAEEFKKFSAKPENIEAFRASLDQQEDYSREKAQGGLYRFFLRRMHGEVEFNTAKFNDIAAKFEAMKGRSPESVRRESARLERAVDELIRLLGINPEEFDPETIQKNAKRLAVFQHWLGAASKQFDQDVKLFSGINMTDLSIEKIAPAGDPEETRSKSWFSYLISFQWTNGPLDWATRKILPGGRNDTGDFAAKVSSKLLENDGWRIFAGPTKDGLSQIERREKIREFMQQGDFQTAADRAAEIDETASGEARKHYRESDIQGLEDFGDDMDTMLTKGFSGEGAAAVNASLTSLQKNFQPYIMSRLVGQGVGDFVVMSVGTLGLGAVEAGATSFASNFLGAGAKLARGTQMMRWAATPLDFGSRVSEGIKMSVVQSLAIPSTIGEFSELGSSFWRSSGRMLLASTQFNLKTIGMFGVTGGAINWGMYELNPEGSAAKSGWDATIQAAVGAVAYGPKSGWVMLNFVPANAVTGKGVVANSYRGFANINGPIDGMSRLIMKIPAMRYRPFARALAEGADGFVGPEGLWVFAAKRAMGTKSPILRIIKSGAIKFMANAEGILKFVGYTEGGAEVFQYIAYHGKNASPGKDEYVLVAKCGDGATDPACYAPSAHMVNLVGARRIGIAAQQGLMFTIPSQGAPDPEGMRKGSAMNAAMMEVFQQGGQKEKDLMKAATGGTDRIKVDITQKTLPIRGLWKHEEELSVSSENQTQYLEMKLRDAFKRKQIDYPELLAMQLIPATEVGKPGTDRTVNYERWANRSDLREFVAGGAFEPKAQEGDAGAYFLKSELSRAAMNITGERLLKDAKMLERIIELKPKDTIIYMTKEGMVETENRDAAQIVKARLDRDPELAAKIPADEKDIKTPIALGGVLKDKKLERSMVEKIVVERLDEDVALAKELAQRALGRGPKEVLDFEGVLINRPSIVRMVQDQVNQVMMKPNEKRLTAAVMEAFRKVEAEKGIDPNALRAEFYRVWDRQIKKEARWGGRRGKILAWAMERTADQRMTEYLARYVADYMVRRLGNVHGEDKIAAEADFAVELIGEILKFGGMKDPRKGTPINKLRGEDTGPMYRRGQKEMIREFYIDFLKGADPMTSLKDSWEKAIKIFSFLEASGGKTLVIKLAFAPLLDVLGERDQKKLWVTSSNRLLAEQMEKEDIPAYSGGALPNYKVSPFDELIFEEVQRKKQGIRSLADEYVLLGDEQDHSYDLTSYTVGEDQGGLTMGSPLLPSNMKGLEWMQGKLAPALSIKDDAKRAEALKTLIPEISKEIPQEAHELAVQRAAEFANVHMMWPNYFARKGASLLLRGGWRKRVDPGTPERLEAENHMKIIRGLYGRMYDITSQPGSTFVEQFKNYRAKHALFDFFKPNDGVETYFRVMLEQQLKTLTLKDPSKAFRIDVDKGTAVPFHNDSAMPTLHTPERYTAQLLLMQELQKRGEWKPVKLENEFKEGIVMQMNEFDQRMKKTHRIGTSGTASEPLQRFYDRLGWVFSNKAGATTLKKTTKLIGEGNGNVTVIDRDGKIGRGKLGKGASSIEIAVPDGIDYRDTEALKLFVQVARSKQKDLLNGERPLNIAVADSLDEARVIEATLVKNGLTTNGEPDARNRPTKDKITRYIPDFMQRMLDGGEYEKMVRVNNKDAMLNGEADWVICVKGICGRGVDMPFGKYKGKVIMYTLHGHDATEVTKEQVQARMGEGRIFLEGVPYEQRGDFIEITHVQTLRADEGRNGYLDNVRKVMDLAADANRTATKDENTEESVKKLKSLLPSDPAELKKLQDGAIETDKVRGGKELVFKDNFKDFAVRGDVYDAVYDAMLQAKQIEHHQQSGIVDANGGLAPDTSVLTDRDVKFIRNTFQFGSMAIAAGLWWFGAPPITFAPISLPLPIDPIDHVSSAFMSTVSGTIAGQLTGFFGKRALANQQAQAAANQAAQSAGPSPAAAANAAVNPATVTNSGQVQPSRNPQP